MPRRFPKDFSDAYPTEAIGCNRLPLRVLFLRTSSELFHVPLLCAEV